ncbi:hypothetical protein HNR40_010505 [Nonomuraea endophytica]|uniref:Uncharacterized protein n=1 Tax=Nonomuraea endophytica TaxID=714136 RepID=A0A7W8AFW6_9ACTN|nr:hypothetical protein [Nonomuraea endophytica]
MPLAGVETADRLADAVLGALRSADLRPPEGRSLPADPAGQVAELLAGGAAVLVLDNCERLVDGVAELVYALLGRLPYLIVLAVSREPLAITGEALCPLGPLGREAAARLFTDRALSVRPGLAPGPEAVADICRRLDGLPLALEPAAARLRSMSVEQVARRLDDRFRLLTSGDRVALPHQPLLHTRDQLGAFAVFDAEYDNLVDDDDDDDDDGHGAGHRQRPAEPHDRPAGDQLPGLAGERGEQGPDAEDDQPEGQHPAAAETVGQAARRDQHPGEDQDVGVQDPLHVGRADSQLPHE